VRELPPVGRFVELIVGAYADEGHPRPSFAMVIIANEDPDLPGNLILGASGKIGDAYTELGCRVLLDFAKRANAALQEIAVQVARDHKVGKTVLLVPDEHIAPTGGEPS